MSILASDWFRFCYSLGDVVDREVDLVGDAVAFQYLLKDTLAHALLSEESMLQQGMSR